MKSLNKTYRVAYQFLEDKAGNDSLKKELSFYDGNKPKSLSDTFKRMLVSLQNKQGYMNYLASVDDMKSILSNYDCHKVYEKYGNDFEALFSALNKKFPNKKFDISNKRNAWVMYTRGVISCAKFLSNYKDHKDFDNFVNSFKFNEYTIAALPMLLEKEIFGFGFPLACDFLKEIGYRDYGKPDVHLKDIFIALDITENDTDYEVFKTIVKMAKEVNQDPVVVDKVFWMIGSGRFEVCGLSFGRLKKEFIEVATRELANG